MNSMASIARLQRGCAPAPPFLLHGLHKKQANPLLVYPNAHRNNGFTPTMPEHPSDVRTDGKTHRSLFERLTALISPEPENRAELLEVLHDAHERNLIDADAL